MWTLMMFGKKTFTMSENGLSLQFAPVLPAYLIPEDGMVEAKFLGSTTVVYHFPEKKDYIPGEYVVGKIAITWKVGKTEEMTGEITGKAAEEIRNGNAESITVEIC